MNEFDSYRLFERLCQFSKKHFILKFKIEQSG